MSIKNQLVFAAVAAAFAISSAPAFAGNPCGNAPKPAPPRAAPPAPAKGAPAEPVMEKEKEAKPAPPPAPVEMKPAAELETLRWMGGANWKCAGKMWNPMTGEEMSSKATIKAKWELDKHWLVWEHSRPKTKVMKSIVTRGILGWDAGNKKVIMSGVDNAGSIFAMWGTQNGDVLQLEGEGTLMGQRMKSRFTFTRKTDKEHTELFEIQQGKDWKKVSEETCKR